MIRGDKVRLIDFDDIPRPTTGWRQPVHRGRERNRRPDVVVFVNGLPLGVIELKNAGQRKRRPSTAPSTSSRPTRPQIPALFRTNAVLVTSDGLLRPDRLADRRPRALHALAHDRWRDDRAEGHAGAGDAARRRVRQAPVPRPDPRLHGVRRNRAGHQDPRRLPPVPRRPAGGRQFIARRVAGGSMREDTIACRASPAQAGATATSDRRDLAHAGLGQEPADGVLCRATCEAIRRWRTRRWSC